MLHLAKYLEKKVKIKAPLSRCLQTAKKGVYNSTPNFIRQFKTYFCVRK